MKFDFGALPGSVIRRPLIEVSLAGNTDIRFPALVDSGATSNKFDIAIADALGIDASAGPVDSFAAGGARHTGNIVDLELRIGRWTWCAPITFVHNWEHPHGILGIDGFFDNFSVRFEATQKSFSLTRRPRHTSNSI